MRFHYLIAAHNEESNIDRACQRLVPIGKKFPGSHVYLLDNGSTDDTWSECLKLQSLHPNLITALHDDRAGIGIAFRMGLQSLIRSELSLNRYDWIVLAAADLPFGLSDLQSVLDQCAESDRDDWVYVGSKAHPLSKSQRSPQRRLGTFALYYLRKGILGLKTKDTQGSIFIRGDIAHYLSDFKSDDYFFSIEVIDRAERDGAVMEVPVNLEPEHRSSRVRPFRDDWRMLRQLIAYRQARESK